MYLLRKIGLAILVAAFILTLSVITSYAQPGRARWEGNNGRHLGWTMGKHKGWYKDKHRKYRYNRYGTSYWDYLRMRERSRYNGYYYNPYGSSYNYRYSRGTIYSPYWYYRRIY